MIMIGYSVSNARLTSLTDHRRRRKCGEKSISLGVEHKKPLHGQFVRQLFLALERAPSSSQLNSNFCT